MSQDRSASKDNGWLKWGSLARGTVAFNQVYIACLGKLQIRTMRSQPTLPLLPDPPIEVSLRSLFPWRKATLFQHPETLGGAVQQQPPYQLIPVFGGRMVAAGVTAPSYTAHALHSGLFPSSSSPAWYSCPPSSVPRTSCGSPVSATHCSGESVRQGGISCPQDTQTSPPASLWP